MKKIITLMLGFIITFAAYNQNNKYGHYIRTLKESEKFAKTAKQKRSKSNKEKKAIANSFYTKVEHGISTDVDDPIVNLLLKYDGAIESALAEYDIRIGSKTKSIATLQIPLSKLDILDSIPEVTGVRLARKVRPRLNESVAMIKGDMKSPDLGTDLTGEGVIIGVIDVDFDVEHPTFKTTDNQSSRILYLLDKSVYPEEDYNTTELIIDKAFPMNYGADLPRAHGTSVASIAAGNGKTAIIENGIEVYPQTEFKGIAPEANLILVKVNKTTTESSIIDGITYIANKAKSLGKPWVINLSVGSEGGPRNGTSWFETAIDEIISDPTCGDGRVVVVAAGNEGTFECDVNSSFEDQIFENSITNKQNRIHALGTGSEIKQLLINADDKCPDFFVSGNPFKRDIVHMEVYLQRASGYTFKITTPGGTELELEAPTSVGNWTSNNQITPDGDVTITWYAREEEEEDYLIINLADEISGTQALNAGVWKIEMTGGTGEWDAYITYNNSDKNNKTSIAPPYFIDYNNTRLMGEPANICDVITVGSINSTKEKWPSCKGNGNSIVYENQEGFMTMHSTGVNNISYFSSPGPSRPIFPTGTVTKYGPDVYAPGTCIATARAYCYFYYEDVNKNTTDLQYMIQQGGTSFAAPHVTGVVALLLQQDPTRDYEDIKNILKENLTRGYSSDNVNVLDILATLERGDDLISDLVIVKGTSTSTLIHKQPVEFNAINYSSTTADSYNWSIVMYYYDASNDLQEYEIASTTISGSMGNTWSQVLTTTLPDYNWKLDANGYVTGLVKCEAVYNGGTNLSDFESISYKIPPTKPYVNMLTSEDNSIFLQFNSLGATQYKIYYGSAPHDLNNLGTSADQGSSPIIIDAEGYNSYTLSGLNSNEYIWISAINAQGESEYSECINFRNYESIPYTTSFESGIESNWTLANEISGEVNQPEIITDNSSHTGTKVLALESGSAASYQDSYIDFNLNLNSETNVILDFWLKEYGDSYDSQDGIWLSANAGQTFTKVYDIDPTQYTNATWQNIVVDIAELAKENGLEMTANFVIRIRQYDNGQIPTKGFAIDDVSIYRGLSTRNITDASLCYLPKPGYDNANTNYGSSTTIRTHQWTSSGYQYKVKNLIDFDISGIQPGSTIQEAKLKLYGDGLHMSNLIAGSTTYKSNASYLSRVTESWNEDEVTWNTMPTYTTENAAELDQSTTTDQDYKADITQVVQDMVDDPENSFGLMLHLQTESAYSRMSFGSSDNTNESLRPSVSIKYELDTNIAILYPEKDAMISYSENPNHSYWKTSNYGTSTAMTSLEWTNSGYKVTQRALIDFDFNSLPDDAIITYAKLSLYSTGNHKNDVILYSGTYKSNASKLYIVETPWEENEVTWVSQPAISTEYPIYLRTSQTATQHYANMDVTGAIRELFENKGQKFGLLFRLENEEKYTQMTFASSDNSNTSLHPKLEISYTSATTSSLKSETVADEQLYKQGTTNIDIAANSQSITVQPNPFDQVANISLYIEEDDNVKITVYDPIGSTIETIVDSKLQEGSYNFEFSPQGDESGIYFIKTTIGDNTTTKKLIKY